MLTLNNDYTEFFNTRTKKVVKFTKAVQREFVDGYSLEEDYRDNEIYVLVYDDLGNKKEIKTLYKSVGSIKIIVMECFLMPKCVLLWKTIMKKLQEKMFNYLT